MKIVIKDFADILNLHLGRTDWQVKTEKIEEEKESNSIQLYQKIKEEDHHTLRIANFEKMFENPEVDPTKIKPTEIFRIQVRAKDVTDIRKICVDNKILLIEEYDHKI